MKGVDHIGIAVSDLEASNKLFEALLNTKCYKIENIPDQKVLTSFFKTRDQKIELVAATDSSSPISKFIDKKGEGIHHIAFEVEDIRAEIDRLQKEGFRALSEEPSKGADNKLVIFFHPKTTNGVLIELCQEIR
jgi:methylmalonyl-CoA/ethylmalonyl-CoA epimerase|tara:strand:- start:621 stop:1022 length:402 start_codon:yes stop_codon:yes gene_type:complete